MSCLWPFGKLYAVKFAKCVFGLHLVASDHSVDMTFVGCVVLHNNIQLTLLFLLVNTQGCLLNKYLLRAFCVCGLSANGGADINQLQIMKHALEEKSRE